MEKLERPQWPNEPIFLALIRRNLQLPLDQWKMILGRNCKHFSILQVQNTRWKQFFDESTATAKLGDIRVSSVGGIDTKAHCQALGQQPFFLEFTWCMRQFSLKMVIRKVVVSMQKGTNLIVIFDATAKIVIAASVAVR